MAEIRTKERTSEPSEPLTKKDSEITKKADQSLRAAYPQTMFL